ncbi:endonuclease/exonuclease/phosphatase family protein [Candidatus Uhrbacteria bacterium]|nr:endonuclease/exonuclease/phosphatase family protein [Candidatus Uhrbacteria bacterium]
MKLISLNTWGGKLFEELIQFIRDQSKDTDIFCFQEIFNTSSAQTFFSSEDNDLDSRVNLFHEITSALPNFKGFYAPAYSGLIHGLKPDFDISYGLATFIKQKIKIKEAGDVFVFKTRGEAMDPESVKPRNLQHITVETGNQKCTLLNFHGLWFGGGLGKGDFPERLTQSQNIKKFLDKTKGPKILCGDFNLWPETESLKMLETDGMTNLNKTHHITCTRSSHYKKEIKFADYMLVSPEIKVNSFQVLPEEVSDHLAMVLDFEIK